MLFGLCRIKIIVFEKSINVFRDFDDNRNCLMLIKSIVFFLLI